MNEDYPPELQKLFDEFVPEEAQPYTARSVKSLMRLAWETCRNVELTRATEGFSMAMARD